ncbi:MAG TPA: tol-pal system protein YbgF [Steroidobacteraceae bacterium]|nr:tol-pal system protein YbgF [Steroidobacteraceae bacterium]
MQLKLADLDGRVGRIERVVSNQSLLDMAQRLDAAQEDVRRLRGRVEELENANEALKKQQRDLYADLDKRLSAVSVGGGSAGLPGAPTPSGAAGASGEQAAYTQAFDALKNSNYPAAITGFRSYLTQYPNGSLADNAQYWLGEAYYVTRDFDQAVAAFRAVGERYPNSRKAPDALLKLGFSQFELKRYGEARATLNDVVRRFPDTDAAKLATDRLARIPAGAR